MTDRIIDVHWAEDQLIEAGYTDKRSQKMRNIREAVMLLVVQFNNAQVATEDVGVAMELFNKLVDGHELVGRNVQAPGARWTDFQLGADTRPGATVRVRENAYEGSAGDRHNGMVGHFVGARGGQAIVQYANSTEGMGHRHPPDKLEVLVRT